MTDTTYTRLAQHDRPVTRFLEGRESARSTIVVMRDGKATSLRVYSDDAGHYYVRTGKRGATKELVVGHTSIHPGRYSFTIKPQWEIDNEWMEERRSERRRNRLYRIEALARQMESPAQEVTA